MKNQIAYIIIGVLVISIPIFIIWVYRKKRTNNILENSSFIDALNGIISPIIGIIGLIIVYMGFESQVKAYNDQVKQWEIERKSTEAVRFLDYSIQTFSDIKKDFSDLEFTDEKSIKHSGFTSITHYGVCERIRREGNENVLLQEALLNFEYEYFDIIANLNDLILYNFENVKKYPTEAKFVANTIERYLSIHHIKMEKMNESVNPEIKKSVSSIYSSIQNNLKQIKEYSELFKANN